MRVKEIVISWFRGSAGGTTLDLAGKSVAVYGDNGAGKSCFVDAIEYVLNDGRIGHLAHEYSGRHQEKAVLNTHRPDDGKAGVRVSLMDGSTVVVTIAPNGSTNVTKSGETDLTTLDCAKTVLRQDEVSHFVHSTKGQKYSVLLPLLGLGHLEIEAENFRQLARAIRKRSGSEAAETVLRRARTRFDKAYSGSRPPTPEETIERTCAAFVTEDHAHDPTKCSELAETALHTKLSDASSLERQQMALQQLGRLSLRSDIRRVREEASSLARAASDSLRDELAALEAARRYLASDDDSDEIACPCCGRDIARVDFSDHIDRRLSELTTVQERVKAYDDAVRALLTTAKRTVELAKGAEIGVWATASTDERVRSAILAPSSCEVPQRDLTEEDVARLEEILGGAVDAAAAAGSFLPPPTTDLVQIKERVQAAHSLYEAQLAWQAAQSSEALAGQVDAIEMSIREEIKAKALSVIGAISADIQRMWEILHPGEPIDGVRLDVPADSDKAIDIALEFYGKELASPRLTLSEGYRNSLGLCVFLAMAARYGDGETPIVLDDVIVSLDRGHRGMVVELLRDEFDTRQVLLFTHDRDWFVDLRQQLSAKQWTFKSLLPYRSPEEGIRWSDRIGTFDTAREDLGDRPATAAHEARKVMDIELSVYAERLGLSLEYMRGARNERRTAHDFLEGMIREGKGSLKIRKNGSYEPFEAAIDSLVGADKLLMTWANRGAHSDDVTQSEAEVLIDTCEEALGHLSCNECNTPVTFNLTQRGDRQCECGALRWR